MPSVLWLGGRKGIRLVKTEWRGAVVVICLERGADLHMAQLMPLPLAVSCFSEIQIGFTFVVPAHPGSPGQRAVKWARVLDVDESRLGPRRRRNTSDETVTTREYTRLTASFPVQPGKPVPER